MREVALGRSGTRNLGDLRIFAGIFGNLRADLREFACEIGKLAEFRGKYEILMFLR